MDIPAKGVQILHEPDQRTAVVIQLFETADDMSAAEGALDAMDTADTPRTRVAHELDVLLRHGLRSLSRTPRSMQNGSP